MATKVFAKVDISWVSHVIVLPADKMAQFMELYAEGMHRENGEYSNRGLTRSARDGDHLALPSVAYLLPGQLNDLYVVGQGNDEEARAKQAEEDGAVATRAVLAAHGS